jgi:hypothetical protein
MPKIKKTLTNHQTWKALNCKDHFQRFFKDYLELLQNKLTKRDVIGHNYSHSYYTCGQPHDRRNRDWLPFQNLEWFCRKHSYDFDAVKDMIEERIGRKLLCECELLHDERTMRRKELELTFGLDFGGPMGREFDIV